MNETRRALLAAFEEGPVAGPVLADQLGISRAAVWKQVDALRKEGFVIESTDDGYEVTGVPEYGAAAIQFGLAAPYTVEYHASVDSTNTRAREVADEGRRDVAVIADEQTGGRGRLDRPWSAPSGWHLVLGRLPARTSRSARPVVGTRRWCRHRLSLPGGRRQRASQMAE